MLLEQLGVEEPRDLGGTMSLNLHLAVQGQVLRVHPPFEVADRLRALRSLREALAANGLSVGRPVQLLGADIVDAGGRLAEAEAFVAATTPEPTWSSYIWMYEAMGRLHRTVNLCAAGLELPVPEVATYSTPDQLRGWIAKTSAAVEGDAGATRLADEVSAMVELLRDQWVAPELLPQQLVHGDIRLGNVASTHTGDAAYFDFGFAARRPRIHELAYSLFWIVLKPDDSGRPEEFDWNRVVELVDAYEAAAGVVLDPLERRALGPCLAAVPMYFAGIASSTPDPCDRIQQEASSLRIARWVLDHPAAVSA